MGVPRISISDYDYSLTEDQIKSSKRTKLIIPAGTYAGQDSDIATTSLLIFVVAYATTGNEVVVISLSWPAYVPEGIINLVLLEDLI